MNNEIIENYNKILDTFILLFPDKINKISKNNTEKDIMNICGNIVSKVNQSSNYKSLLLNNKCKLFKAIKLSFIPKIKMELVLYIDENDLEERKNNINLIWSYIKNIFILMEKTKDNPDENYIKLLENKIINNSIVPLIDDKAFKILENFGINKNQILELLNNNKGSGDIINNIIKEIKDTPLYKNRGNKKVSLKEIITNTTELQDKYTKLFTNGELNISDIVGSLMNIMTNQTEYEKISKELDIDNLIDTDNIIKDLTELLPLEYRTILNSMMSSNMDMSSSNIFDLFNNLMSENKEVKELSQDQLKEIEDFYSNLKI